MTIQQKMKSQKGDDRQKKLNELVHNLFNGITEDDVMRFKDGKLVMRNKEITKEEIEVIRRDAEVFKDSVIWNVLKRELQLAANERMFDYAREVDDMMFGKAMLYNLDLIDKKLKNLVSLGISRVG